MIHIIKPSCNFDQALKFALQILGEYGEEIVGDLKIDGDDYISDSITWTVNGEFNYSMITTTRQTGIKISGDYAIVVTEGVMLGNLSEDHTGHKLGVELNRLSSLALEGHGKDCSISLYRQKMARFEFHFFDTGNDPFVLVSVEIFEHVKPDSIRGVRDCIDDLSTTQKFIESFPLKVLQFIQPQTE